MSDRKCGNCEHFGLGPAAVQGNLSTACRRYPPTVMPMMAMDPRSKNPIQVLGSVFPGVAADDLSCGEWRQRIRENLAALNRDIAARRVPETPAASNGVLAP